MHLSSASVSSQTARGTRLRLRVLLMVALHVIVSSPSAWADTMAVGDGKAASETRSTGEFTAVDLRGGMALELRQGSPAAVVVHAESNLLPLLESVVEGEQTLQLRWKAGISVRANSRVWVEVTAPQIRSISSAGSGDVTIDSMKVPRLAVSIQGSGGVRAKGLNNDELSLGIAGSGAASLAGRAARLSIELSGSGGIDAAELRADDVRVRIAGSGDASVHAAHTLAVSIAGSGNVIYSGDPTVQRTIAGSGSVRKR